MADPTSTRPVVLAFDGSDGAATAVARAGDLFRGRPAHVLSVWEPLPPLVGPVDLAEVDAQLRKGADALCESGAEAAAAAGFEVVGRHALRADPAWKAAVELTAEVDAAALVVGARGRSAVAAMLLGSFSRGAVHHASCPVLVVHESGADAVDQAPLLIGYDGSDSAKRAIACAADLFPGRRSLVLHVWEPLSAVASVPPLPGLQGLLVSGLAEMDKLGRDASQTVAEDGARQAQEAGLAAEPLSEQREGRAWRAILAIAREREAPLIVVGRRGASAAEMALVGSISGGVVQHAEGAVLVVPDR